MFEEIDGIEFRNYTLSRLPEGSLNIYNYKGLETMCELYTEEKVDKVPRVATVEIEQLIDNDDLSAGVKTKSLKEINLTPKIYKVPKVDFFNKSLGTQDVDGNHVIAVESYCHVNDVVCDPTRDQVWGVFYSNGLQVIDSYVTRVNDGKFVKVGHYYKVTVTDINVVPYIQFVCFARKCRYLENWFKEGEVVTLFVHHHYAPNIPSPSILSVSSKCEQTYVPMLPKQKLQIVTDASISNLEWKFGANSPLIYQGHEYINSESARKIGTNVRCDFFECVCRTKTQELVFINFNQQFKTICVPVVYNSGNRRYPVIIDPVRTCIIYAHNIDGFILRSHHYISLYIEKNCPLQEIYTLESCDYNETKINITKFKPYFVLERVNNQWIARSK